MIMNTIFGYWRCSTDAQDQDRQIRALKDAGTLQEFKERRYHTKKSQEKRVQKEKAVWFQKCQDIRDNE